MGKKWATVVDRKDAAGLPRNKKWAEARKIWEERYIVANTWSIRVIHDTKCKSFYSANKITAAFGLPYVLEGTDYKQMLDVSLVDIMLYMYIYTWHVVRRHGTKYRYYYLRQMSIETS